MTSGFLVAAGLGPCCFRCSAYSTNPSSGLSATFSPQGEKALRHDLARFTLHRAVGSIPFSPCGTSTRAKGKTAPVERF